MRLPFSTSGPNINSRADPHSILQSIEVLGAAASDGSGLAQHAMHKLMLAFFSIRWASRAIREDQEHLPSAAKKGKTAKTISATNRLLIAFEDVSNCGHVVMFSLTFTRLGSGVLLFSLFPNGRGPRLVLIDTQHLQSGVRSVFTLLWRIQLSLIVLQHSIDNNVARDVHCCHSSKPFSVKMPINLQQMLLMSWMRQCSNELIHLRTVPLGSIPVASFGLGLMQVE